MNMLAQFSINQATMSSRVIAEICEKDHPHVKRDCEVMFKGLKLDASKFGGIYLDSMNRQQTEYLLDEELTMTLVTGYSIVLRNRVIKRWKELENQSQSNAIALPNFTDPAEAARAWAEQFEAKQLAEKQIAVLAPKAEALETIANTENTYCLRQCAKTICIRESDLIQLLIDKKWIYREPSKTPGKSGKLQPHAQYVTNKVFINRISPVITNQYTGQEMVHTHMRVTAFGLTRITGLVNKVRKAQQVAA